MAPYSQSAFVSKVYPDTKVQREMSASEMVRKGEYSVLVAALLHLRAVLGKKHRAVPPASTTCPARSKPGSFPGDQIPNIVIFFVTLVFCSLWQKAAAAAAP